MSWCKKLAEKWRRFIEETSEANAKMWKGQAPYCYASHSVVPQ